MKKTLTQQGRPRMSAPPQQSSAEAEFSQAQTGDTLQAAIDASPKMQAALEMQKAMDAGSAQHSNAVYQRMADRRVSTSTEPVVQCYRDSGGQLVTAAMINAENNVATLTDWRDNGVNEDWGAIDPEVALINNRIAVLLAAAPAPLAPIPAPVPAPAPLGAALPLAPAPAPAPAPLGAALPLAPAPAPAPAPLGAALPLAPAPAPAPAPLGAALPLAPAPAPAPAPMVAPIAVVAPALPDLSATYTQKNKNTAIPNFDNNVAHLLNGHQPALSWSRRVSFFTNCQGAGAAPQDAWGQLIAAKTNGESFNIGLLAFVNPDAKQSVPLATAIAIATNAQNMLSKRMDTITANELCAWIDNGVLVAHRGDHKNGTSFTFWFNGTNHKMNVEWHVHWGAGNSVKKAHFKNYQMAVGKDQHVDVGVADIQKLRKSCNCL